MRADLLRWGRGDALEALDLDFRHLFASWFNRGFLVLRPINWTKARPTSLKRSSPTKRSTPSTAGMTCAAAWNRRTGAASPSSTPPCRTSR
jgi:hypothetical protein